MQSCLKCLRILGDGKTHIAETVSRKKKVPVVDILYRKKTSSPSCYELRHYTEIYAFLSH